MANQMIALGIKSPQIAVPSAAQMSNVMANLAVTKEKQAGIQRSNAFRELVSSPNFDAANPEHLKIAQSLDPTGAAALAKSSDDRRAANLKFAGDFVETSGIALSHVRDASQAKLVGDKLKQMFPAFADAVDQTIASIPQDPAQFHAWRENALAQTMDAKDQLAQEFTTQNLGTSTRVLRTPKYGRGAGEVVPGSEAAVTIKPTVVNVEGLGPMVVDPNTNTAYPAAAGATGGVPVGRGGAQPTPSIVEKKNPAAMEYRPWMQKYGATKEGRFARFPSVEANTQAQHALLNNYVSGGTNTINKIIDKYAPAHPENPEANRNNYKSFVAQRTGLNLNQPITAAQVPAVASAIRAFETGNRGGQAAAPSTVAEAATSAQNRQILQKFTDITGVNWSSGKDPVAGLIEGSTSGGAEQFGAAAKAFLPEGMGGGSTEGMKKIAELGVIKSNLLTALMPGGRLSTGVSDEDRKAVEKQIANIDDASIPASTRLAAWKRAKQIIARRGGVDVSAPSGQTAGGKKRKSLSAFGGR